MGTKIFFKYYGGKNYIVKWLLRFVPPHTKYLELFGGSGALLFNKKPVQLEVFNDIDEDLINLYRVVRDKEKFVEFQRLAALTPYSRAEYNHQRNLYQQGIENDLERALAFWVMITQGFSGVIKGGGWSFIVGHTQSKVFCQPRHYLSRVNNLPYFHQRLQTVQIDCLSWGKAVETYAEQWDKTGFVYCDPPYLPETRKRIDNYPNEMTQDDHERFLDWAISAKTNVMISGYSSPLYNKLDNSGWERHERTVLCAAPNRKRLKIRGIDTIQSYKRTECVWINYDMSAPENLPLFNY